LQCHSGSFYALPEVYTGEFLVACRQRIERAIEAAADAPQYAARVAMASEGLKNAEQCIAIRDAMNRGDFRRAKKIYTFLLARSVQNQSSGLGNHYTVNYLRRFLGKHVESGAAATARPNRVLRVLPDRWRLEYDPTDQGRTQNFHRSDYDDRQWQQVATYSATLDAQGIDDRQTVMWYRTSFELPKKPKANRLALFFTEVDGTATVYVNGHEVGGSQDKRTPFSVDVTRAMTLGKNVVAVRVDHSKITDLFLGGILRPVLLVALDGAA
jgi:hypothetical protein